MSLPRFYFADFASESIERLTADQGHHAATVLRLKAGDEIELFDGTGRRCPATVISADKKNFTVHTGVRFVSTAPAASRFHLGISMLTGDKLDWVIEKAVEIGAGAITIIDSQRSKFRLDPDRIEKKRTHWHSILVAACAQCGRDTLPRLEGPFKLRDLPIGPKTAVALLAPDAECALQTWLDAHPSRSDELLFVTGPESGWTVDELDIAQQRNMTKVRLGSNILRAETAPIVALAAGMALTGTYAS